MKLNTLGERQRRRSRLAVIEEIMEGNVSAAMALMASSTDVYSFTLSSWSSGGFISIEGEDRMSIYLYPTLAARFKAAWAAKAEEEEEVPRE